MKRFALALVACLWASTAFAQQPPARALQQSEPGSGNAGYPPGATPQNNACGAADTAGLLCSLPSAGGVPGQYTYLCGFEVTGLGVTGGPTTVLVVINNIGLVFEYTFVTGVTLPNTPLYRPFWPCLRVGAIGAVAQISVPGGGAGNTSTSIDIWGYTQ